MRSVEHDRLPGEPIEVRGEAVRGTVGPESVGALLVGGDDEDVQGRPSPQSLSAATDATASCWNLNLRSRS